MTCKFCASSSPRFNFNSECCLVRWLRGAYKPHAKAWLERYRRKHGQQAMMDLISKAKGNE